MVEKPGVPVVASTSVNPMHGSDLNGGGVPDTGIGPWLKHTAFEMKN
jgi:hypothetical protein